MQASISSLEKLLKEVIELEKIDIQKKILVKTVRTTSRVHGI